MIFNAFSSSQHTSVSQTGTSNAWNLFQAAFFSVLDSRFFPCVMSFLIPPLLLRFPEFKAAGPDHCEQCAVYGGFVVNLSCWSWRVSGSGFTAANHPCTLE